MTEERRAAWIQLSGGVIESGGSAGIARFLAIADFIITKQGGGNLYEWIDVAFDLLPKADQTALLANLVEAYVTNRPK